MVTATSPHTDEQDARLTTSPAPPSHVNDMLDPPDSSSSSPSSSSLHPPLDLSNNMDDKPDNHHSDRLTLRRALVFLSMAILWTASQMPIYFYGAISIPVLVTLGGYAQFAWLGLASLIPLAIVTPFVGMLSDLFGRRHIGLAALAMLILGNALCGAAPSMGVFLTGTIIISMGSGIGELISLAVVAEIALTRLRGVYVGGMVLAILPLCPAALYAQLITHRYTWRWIGLMIGAWAAVGFVLTASFYWPPKTKTELTRRELARRIDWIGGLLSAAAITLIAVGLSFPTSGATWTDPRTLSTLISGLILAVCFTLYEWKLAPYPMVPARLKDKNPRVLTIILLIIFVSGANFFAVLIYWPTQYQTIYAAPASATSLGLGSLPATFGIILGSLFCTPLITFLQGNIRLLLLCTTALMVAFNGALAAATPDNLPVVWFVVSFACLGVGATLVPTQVIAGIVCPEDLLATMTALTITIRIIGGCLAYAIYTAIFAAKFQSEALASLVPTLASIGIDNPAEVSQIVETIRGGGFALLDTFPGIDSAEDVELLARVGREVLARSYPVVYYASVVFGVVALVGSWFLKGIGGDMGREAVVKLM